MHVEITEIKNEYVLLDTNVLIDSFKYPEEFKEFYSFLEKHKVQSVVDMTVTLELNRGAKTQKIKSDQEKFLKLLFAKKPLTLKWDDEIILNAEKISNILNRTENKTLSLGDSLIAGQLKKYSSNTYGKLFFATQNHSDFLPILFTPIHFYQIRLSNGTIKLIGLYKFNLSQYQTLQ